MKDYDYSSWIALFAPKGISVAALAELRKQTQSVVNDPAIQQKMSNAGLDPWPKSPEQLSKIMQHDFVKWQTIIKDANIKGG